MKLRARLTGAAAGAFLSLAAATSTRALDIPIVWDGDTSTTWSDGANWVGDQPPAADDHAKITGVFTNQPTLTGAASVGGIWITALGQDYAAVANENVLSIGGNTINGISNVAVLFDSTSGFNAAVSNKISITNNNLVIRNDTDHLLNFNAANTSVASPGISLNSNTLTFSANGAGEITMGSVGGTGGVTINSSGTGVVRGNTNNTSFSGQFTIERGVFATAGVNNNGANGRFGNSALPVHIGSNGFAGTLQFIGGSGTSSNKGFVIAEGGSAIFDLQATSSTAAMTLSGVIEGTGPVEVKGTNGSVILSGASTYSGGTTLTSGTLTLGSSSTGTSGPIGTGTLTMLGGTLSVTGTRTVGNTIVINGSVGINPASALTLSGPLTSTSSSDVIDIGTGTSSLNITGDVSGYHGTFSRASTDGTLNFGANDVNLSNARIVMTGASEGNMRYLRFGDSSTGTTASIKIGELSGSGIVNPSAGGTSLINLEVGHLNTDSLFSGNLLGRGSQTYNLTKVGTGALTLSGPSTYGGIIGGVTTVSAGTLIAGADAVSTNVTGIPYSGTSGSDFLTAPGHNLTVGDRVAFQGAPAGGIAALTTYHVVDVTGDNFKIAATSGGTPITFTANQPAGTIVAEVGAFGAGNTAVVVGDANTALPSSWNPVGNNAVNLLTGGAVTIERAVTVAATGSTGVAGIGGLAPVDSTFSGLVSFHRNLSVGQTTDGGTLNITGGLRGSSGNAKTLTFGSATVVPVYAPNALFGNINVSSAIDEIDGGTVSVEVTGGNVTFGGNNSYSGTTTVTAGKLLVNGTHTGGGAYSVAGGATLGGTGTIGSSVVINNNATLSPGASVGTLTISSADIDGKLLIEYNGDTSTIDKLTVSGALDITNAILDFDNLGSAALGGGPYVFASYGSLIGSAFSSVVDPPAGFSIDYSYLGNQIALFSTTVQSGDFDGDGDVDGADFVVWQTNFPKTGTGSQSTGDANGDGNVDGGDFAVWQDQFPTPSGGGASPVPEPGAIALAVMGFIGLCVGMRKNRK